MKITNLQMDILMILSDEQGHANWDLAEKLGKHKSNLVTPLSELEDIEIYPVEDTSMHLSAENIKDPIGLAKKIVSARDSLSKTITDNLDSNILKFLKELVSERRIIVNINDELKEDKEKIAEILVKELNRIIDGPSIHKHISPDIRLESITERLFRLGGQLDEINIPYRNRFLLEDAYRDYLRRGYDESFSVYQIIYKDLRPTTHEDSIHPRQTEHPYYISKDLWIFQYIMFYFENKDKEFEIKIYDLIKKRNYKIKKIKKLESDTPVKEEEIRKLNLEITAIEAQLNGLMDKSNENLHRLEQFLHSPYIGCLIRDFGINRILDVAEFSDKTQDVRKKILIYFKEKDFISMETFKNENNRLNLGFSFTSQGRIWKEVGWSLCRYATQYERLI